VGLPALRHRPAHPPAWLQSYAARGA
jgi:hypothetical protein